MDKPTPTLELMHDADNGRYLIMRGPVLIADCGKGVFGKTEAKRIVQAVNAYEKDQEIKKELVLAAKDALLMLKDLSDSLHVRPEMFRNAAPVDRLFKAIAKAGVA